MPRKPLKEERPCCADRKALTAAIIEAHKAGERTAIPSLGTFEVSAHAARIGHDSRSDETVEIAVKRIPAFKAAKALKCAVE